MAFETLVVNHTGIVVGDLDYAINFFVGLLNFSLQDRGFRNVENQSKVTGLDHADVEIAYVSRPDHTLELICYKDSPATTKYYPRPYDIGHWHLSVNINDIAAAIEESEQYGLSKVAGLITVDNGPNKGNQIIYMAMPDGVTIEFVQPFNV